MILSYLELRREAQGRWIAPVADEHMNASSIDVTLGGTILTEARGPGLKEGELAVVTLREREAIYTESVELSDTEPFLLYPGAFILAQTAETFNLPLDVSAEFRLKSSSARMGLGHALAVWCDPGWHGSVLTLELHNSTQEHIIALHRGDRIGQMIFHRHHPVPERVSYRTQGAYNNDKVAQATKPPKKKRS